MSTALTEQKPQAAPHRLTVHDESAIGYMMDTAKFDHCWRIAQAMAAGSLLPDHLALGRDKRPLAPANIAGNCFRIVNQALRWNMDPFALVDETYVVGNKLGYQGKLVAAVVNARAGLESRLRYTFDGAGDARTVTVVGRFRGETEDRTVRLSVAQAKTANQMWTKDPDQKLCYSGVTKWARRHCPEIMLGVLTDDDIERVQQAGVKLGLGENSLDQLADKLLTAEPQHGKPQAEAGPAQAAHDAADSAGPAPEAGGDAAVPAQGQDQQPGQPGPAAAPPPPSESSMAEAEYLELLPQAESLAAVNTLEKGLDKDTRFAGDEAARARVRAACGEKRETIRRGRGERSGQKNFA